MEKIFVSVREACQISGLSRNYIYACCNTGKIPCLRMGNRGDIKINLPAFLDLIDRESRGE